MGYWEENSPASFRPESLRQKGVEDGEVSMRAAWGEKRKKIT
jgi:hypothetical protein